MADEVDARGKEDEAPRAAEKKSGKKVMMIVLVLVVAIVGAGAFYVMKYGLPFGKESSTEAVAEEESETLVAQEEKKTSKEEQTEEEHGEGGEAGGEGETSGTEGVQSTLYALDPFVVNLAGSAGRRYLKATVQLEVNDPATLTEIEARLPAVRDNILTLLSSKTYDDIEDARGKDRLKEELIYRVNSFLKAGKVEHVYFTEFIVQ